MVYQIELESLLQALIKKSSKVVRVEKEEGGGPTYVYMLLRAIVQ